MKGDKAIIVIFNSAEIEYYDTKSEAENAIIDALENECSIKDIQVYEAVELSITPSIKIL